MKMGDVDNDDLPYLAEYAKSGRASCKGCKKPIDKDSLRLATMVQSPRFDGKMPLWFHFLCFFEKNRIKSLSDIKQFGQLRWDDQQKIKDKLVPQGAGGVQADVSSDSNLLKDFLIDRAKSSRSVCRGCEEKIAKDFLRVSKKDYESANAKRFGPVDRWYHLTCFAKNRDDLEFFPSGSLIPGFDTLSKDDQELVKQELPESKSSGSNKRPLKDGDESPLKKIKKEESNEEEDLKMQNKIIYEYRDKLHKELSKSQWQEMLLYNQQQVPSGESKILDRLADCMTFGALLPCPECSGQLSLGTGEYCCNGNITEWTKCLYAVKTPKRMTFDIPKDLKNDHLFLKKYKYVARERIFSSVETAPSTSQLPLSNLKVAIVGKTKSSKVSLTGLITSLGGKVVNTISSDTAIVISTKEEIEKESKKIEEAKANNVPVVSENFIKDLKVGNVNELIKQYNIGGWGENSIERIKSGKVASKSEPMIKKITVKGVDPDSGLEDVAHVLEEKKQIYMAVLNLVDVVKGTNSYYKLQLLEANDKKTYWIFRAWGRIGTSVGGTKVEKFLDKSGAKDSFKSLYEEKTGNVWGHGKKFIKYPNKFYPMELDDGNEQVKSLKDIQSDVPSKLPKQVQNLVISIFDIDTMKKTMIEFEIDMNKMPLGKLSRRQIEMAYKILTELQEIFNRSESDTKALDASNRFYTLIPHDFGMKKPPILNNLDIIKMKIEMLDNLLEIEVAYNILKEVDSSNKNPIDAHFITLKTNIDILEKSGAEFKLLEDYAKNTHAATHNQYTLKIKEIFKIKRNGEEKRFKPFKKLKNRMLLWHGSRISNFVGILSRGLQIAPPEAPVTGYMFGKGIYFADMISKSANYCFATKENPMGLLLLCEVALGEMHELKNADFITKLPNGKHSTKGVGSTEPDPKIIHTTEDGVIIPYGKPTKSSVTKTSLLYNEYIVYDIAQVNVKYLMQVEFKYKY